MYDQKKLRQCTIAVLLIALLLTTSGCTRQDWLDLVDIGRAWAQANNILDANGKPTWSTIGRATLGVSTGDPSVDAAIDAGQVVKNFNEAEKLSEAGLQEQDINKVDQAIALRPKDYSYHNQRAAMLFFQDDQGGAQAEFGTADNLAQNMNKAAVVSNLESRAKYLMLQHVTNENQLEQQGTDIDSTAYIYSDKEREYRSTLASTYKQLYELTGKAEYKQRYEDYSW